MLVLMTFTLMVSAPIMCVGGIIMALGQDVPLSAVLLAVVPVLGIAVSLIVRRMRPLFRTMQERLDTVNRVLREQITGNRVIRAFVRDGYEEKRFRGANTELTDVALSTGRLMALMFPTVMTVVNVSSIAVVWFGAHRIDSGGMEIGALTAFLSYLMQIVMSVMMATFMFMMVPRAEVCAERIEEVLETDSSVVPPVKPVRELRAPRSSGGAGRGLPLPGRRGAGAARRWIWWHAPARRPRSSGRRAAGSRRCSASYRGCSTRRTVRCWSTARTCGRSSRRCWRRR